MNRREQLAYIVGLAETGSNRERVIKYAEEIGIKPRMHEGLTGFSEDMKAEWIIGQIVNIYLNPNGEHIFNLMAINSALNIAKSFFKL